MMADQGLSPIFPITMALGSSVVLAGTSSLGAMGAIGLGAVSAAAGSIVSQGVGIAIGQQQSFSWSQVALSAVGGAVSGGLGASGAFGATGGATGSQIGNQIVRGAVGSAVSQGVAVATGLRDSFNWTAVAASAVGAGVGSSVSNAVSQAFGAAAEFAERLSAGTAAGVATTLASGGRVSAQQVAVDAFGNALGSSLVDAMSSDRNPSNANYRNEMDRESDGYTPAAAYNYRNGSDIDSDNAAADRQRRDAMYGLAGSGSVRLGAQRRDAVADWSRETDEGIAWAANSGDRNGLDAQSDAWVAANGPGKPGRTRLIDKELLAAQARERFNFSDGRDARDIRLGFGYQSRVARALSDSSIGGSSGSTYASASVLSTRETATAMFSSLVGTSRAGNVATGAFNAWLAAPEALSRPIETVSAIGSAAVQLAEGGCPTLVGCGMTRSGQRQAPWQVALMACARASIA